MLLSEPEEPPLTIELDDQVPSFPYATTQTCLGSYSPNKTIVNLGSFIDRAQQVPA